MSGRARTVYRCQGCGHGSAKWLGRCPQCGGWNLFVEETEGGDRPAVLSVSTAPAPVTSLGSGGDERVSTGLGELDRVLGGGLVRGSAVLVGGDPGIGKSTLLLQACGRMAEKGAPVLYVSGEESRRQIRLRAERLGVLSDRLLVQTETSLGPILSTIEQTSPRAVVVDSVQTVFSDSLDAAPGSVGQLREVTARLTALARGLDVPVFLVGHVTKEGVIAGPRVLEHMVDTVLYFEGEGGHPFRVLRAVKNRYGSAMEIGVFEMTGSGLDEVTNPSRLFLAERPVGASGSAVLSCLEGTRTILVEVQSLVCPTVFGVPRRTVVGVDASRVSLMVAVLEKKAGIMLAGHDIYVKVTGGIRVDEPAADLGIIASVASNFLDRAVDPGAVIFGEVGLAGEVRAVSQAGQRVREAEKLGFTSCILPSDNLRRLKDADGAKMTLTGVASVAEAMERLFAGSRESVEPAAGKRGVR
ncbi:MAG TPA: DNA repair protein RadA [Deltaproteobacteria bacterium]|nr:DNA repair protein RadA [Deltaproteobacteria bacterium]